MRKRASPRAASAQHFTHCSHPALCNENMFAGASAGAGCRAHETAVGWVLPVCVMVSNGWVGHGCWNIRFASNIGINIWTSAQLNRGDGMVVAARKRCCAFAWCPISLLRYHLPHMLQKPILAFFCSPRCCRALPLVLPAPRLSCAFSFFLPNAAPNRRLPSLCFPPGTKTRDLIRAERLAPFCFRRASLRGGMVVSR